VLIHDEPAARVGDRAKCNAPPDTIVMGEPSVLVGGKPAARVGDPTSHGGVIVAGCSCVQIGRLAQAVVMKEAAATGAAFCEECARQKALKDAKKGKGSKQAAEKKPEGKSEKPAPKEPVGEGVAGRPATQKERAKRPPLPPESTLQKNGRAIDVDKAIAHLNRNAEKGSIGKCGRYTQNAIVAGGGNIVGANAKDSGPNLERIGFQSVADQNDYKAGRYQAQPGDVVVFAASGSREWGHTAMWNGSRWVSDFSQKNFYVHTDYHRGSFKIYRP